MKLYHSRKDSYAVTYIHTFTLRVLHLSWKVFVCMYSLFPPIASRSLCGIFATDAKICNCAELRIRSSHLPIKQI
jgi:hypothetical protein